MRRGLRTNCAVCYALTAQAPTHPAPFWGCQTPFTASLEPALGWGVHTPGLGCLHPTSNRLLGAAIHLDFIVSNTPL